ncbi:MAG TPA: hypothetical protein VK629_00530 [Steroidobacteraceae bacterium]|nr:hypothetical protein [Steroidobacteraceae bacterium]
MRHIENRYVHERLGLELALRLIRFEARTCTIRHCTGLTDDRIRKLYRTYIAGGGETEVTRRRGKSPREIESVLRNADVQKQASLIAGAFASHGLLRGDNKKSVKIDVRLAQQLCDAYDFYARLLTEAPLSFEHAWFLWLSLTKGSDLVLHPCAHCEGFAVQDRYSIRQRPCPWCGQKNEVASR